MVWTARFASFLRRLFHRNEVEEDLDAEIQAHFELLAARLMEKGMPPEAARRITRLRFGGPEQVKQKVRENRAGAAPEAIFQDMRYGLRSLRKSPVITAVAILSLALGIGANTAIFSVINAVLLRSLPVHDPDQLVSIQTLGPEDGDRTHLLSFAMFDELRKRQQVFSNMFAWDGGHLDTFSAKGKYFAGMLTAVSGDYFGALGVQPLLGRFIQPSDVAMSSGTSAQVAVLGYSCWQTRFHGDPAVVGKSFRVDDIPLTVIGVAPRAFAGLIIDLGEDVIIPLGAKGDRDFRQRQHADLEGFARLKPGISIEKARAQMEAIWPAVQRATEPEGYTGLRRARFYARKIKMESAATGRSNMRERLATPLAVLMTLVGMVLLIGCVNLANLMLARAAGRRHELAVRKALGAGHWRIVRQLLTESMLLSVTGAGLGFLFARWTSRLLLATMWTFPTPLALDPAPDVRVLAFTAGLSILTAVLFGLAPAWTLLREDMANGLRWNTHAVRRSGRIGKVLVTGQIALSTMAVLAAALFVRSLKNMQAGDAGFDRHGVLVMQLMAQPGRQPTSNRRAYYKEIVDRVGRLPGVTGVSFSVMGPVNRGEWKQRVGLDLSSESPREVAGDIVGPGFFRTIGMRVLTGREFAWSDDAHAPAVTILSQSLATSLFPGRDPVGQYVQLNPGANGKRLQVVGVVNSASLWRIQSHEPEAIYSPLLQAPPTGAYLDIRSANDPSSVSGAAARIVEGMGHEYPLFIQTLDGRMERMTVDERMTAWLSTFFAALALLLAAIGLYGLMADMVARRTPEIGVRMALGARRGNVIWLVLRQVLALVGTGVLIGLPTALAVSKAIAGMLFGLSANDPGTMALASIILLTSAILAGYVPAWYASRIDPVRALRTE